MGLPLGPNDSIQFLDIEISRGNNKFTISVYRKPTLGRGFTNFGSFIPNLQLTLLHTAFKLCSSFELFHQQINMLKTIFENSRSQKFCWKCVLKKYLDEAFIKRKWCWKLLKKTSFASFLLSGKIHCNWELI